MTGNGWMGEDVSIAAHATMGQKTGGSRGVTKKRLFFVCTPFR